MSHRVTLEWRDGREELGVPYGFLYGACGTCTGRLLDGDLVHAERPRPLKPRHRRDGYVLLCVAEPRSDCRIEVGAAVQADLVPNPWK